MVLFSVFVLGVLVAGNGYASEGDEACMPTAQCGVWLTDESPAAQLKTLECKCGQTCILAPGREFGMCGWGAAFRSSEDAPETANPTDLATMTAGMVADLSAANLGRSFSPAGDGTVTTLTPDGVPAPMPGAWAAAATDASLAAAAGLTSESNPQISSVSTTSALLGPPVMPPGLIPHVENPVAGMPTTEATLPGSDQVPIPSMTWLMTTPSEVPLDAARPRRCALEVRYDNASRVTPAHDKQGRVINCPTNAHCTVCGTEYARCYLRYPQPVSCDSYTSFVAPACGSIYTPPGNSNDKTKCLAARYYCCWEYM
jgi:hypothetical protein